MEPQNTKEPSSISWEIERLHNGGKGDWFYFTVLALMSLLLLFAVWQKNFLFGVFVILAVGTIFFLSMQRQQTYAFHLDDRGLLVAKETFYEYDRFRHFDIYEFSDEEYEIFFVFKEKLRPILRIRIYKSDRKKIADFLSRKLPQKKTEPSLLDIFSKIVGI